MAAIPFYLDKAGLRVAVLEALDEAIGALVNVLLDSVRHRIASGYNVNDQPAKPLKVATKGRYRSYADQKRAKGLQGIRDWTYTGAMLRSMKTQTVQNAATVYFDDARADRLAFVLNQGEIMFGISPKNREAVENKFAWLVENGYLDKILSTIHWSFLGYEVYATRGLGPFRLDQREAYIDVGSGGNLTEVIVTPMH